jgi:Protein of unknown function (DUF3551)
MRNIILAATAVIGIAAATIIATSNARAENYPWCAVLSMGDAAYNCGFTTIEQCRATVSGVGGFCELNRFYDEPVRAPAKRMRRSG